MVIPLDLDVAPTTRHVALTTKARCSTSLHMSLTDHPNSNEGSLITNIIGQSSRVGPYRFERWLPPQICDVATSLIKLWTIFTRVCHCRLNLSLREVVTLI